MKKLFQDCIKLKYNYEKVVIKSNKLKKIIKKEKEQLSHKIKMLIIEINDEVLIMNQHNKKYMNLDTEI